MPLERLATALAAQRDYLRSYEQPSEPVVYETLRALDDLFCRDLMEPDRPVPDGERRFRSLATWGVNHALRRIIPGTPIPVPFRNFPSHESFQDQADDFVFNCGVLCLAERFEGWLRDGLVSAELRPYPNARQEQLKDILILRTSAPSCYDEEIGMAGLRWAADLRVRDDRQAELRLECRHRDLEPELQHRVHLHDGWLIEYSSTRAIDDYFLDWGRLYLRRIFSQDMIGPDDVIGGRPFSQYVEVLAALSGRAQKHIAYAAILRARHRSVHIRNLLTTHCPRQDVEASLADYLDADRDDVSEILKSLTLCGKNVAVHTAGASTAWAPLVQASVGSLILPIYGLDINPYLFLMTDLRYRYETDWFRLANKREARWTAELDALFKRPGWHTHPRSLRLREGGKEVTDIDFSVYDQKSNELALFQLKWQHPVGFDNRGRRSAGKNLVEDSNRWVDAVCSWLERNGVESLMERLSLKGVVPPSPRLFVLGRYHAHLSGFSGRDDRAVWSDWGHFCRAKHDLADGASLSQLECHLRASLDRVREAKTRESLMFPLGDLAVLVNPTRVPPV
jgi:hypothetical protein